MKRFFSSGGSADKSKSSNPNDSWFRKLFQNFKRPKEASSSQSKSDEEVATGKKVASKADEATVGTSPKNNEEGNVESHHSSPDPLSKTDEPTSASKTDEPIVGTSPKDNEEGKVEKPQSIPDAPKANEAPEMDEPISTAGTATKEEVEPNALKSEEIKHDSAVRIEMSKLQNAIQSGNSEPQISRAALLRGSIQTLLKTPTEEIKPEEFSKWMDTYERLMRDKKPTFGNIGMENSMQIGLHDIIAKLESSRKNLLRSEGATELEGMISKADLVQKNHLERLESFKDGLDAEALQSLHSVSLEVPWLQEILFPEKGINFVRNQYQYEELINSTPAKTELQTLKRLESELRSKNIPDYIANEYKKETKELSDKIDHFLVRLTKNLSKSNDETDTATKFANLAMFDYFMSLPKIIGPNQGSPEEWYIRLKTREAQNELSGLLGQETNRPGDIWDVHRKVAEAIIKKHDFVKTI